MQKEINIEEIESFKSKYDKEENNKITEERIRELGIMQASADNLKRAEFKFDFNIEVPEVKIYNQLDSHQCNIYAFLRVIKDILRNNTNLNVDNINFSSNYINFFDKLEKANILYNELIECKKISLEIINKKVNHYIGSFGTFHFCREIVNKYGLVTSKYMKEVNSNYSDRLTVELLREKIKIDATSLMKIRFKSERKKKKEKLMYEVYQFLAKVYGEPPIDFEFDGEVITPLEFKNRYLKDALDDFVTVTSLESDALFGSYSFIPNIYLNNNERIVHASSNKIKDAIIRQLRDGISVWFSAEESTTLDYDDNILDDKLYDVYKMLNIDNLSKKNKMILDIINYDHAMTITGALLDGDEVKQFKVDNSFGRHGKFKGQLIMTNSFLENCVITVIINKKYL